MSEPDEKGTLSVLDQFLLNEGSVEFFIARFQDNLIARRRYQLVTKEGENLLGIPWTHSKVGDTNPEFILFGAKEQYHRIPFARLASAYEIPEPDDRYFMGVAIEESRRSVSEGTSPKPLVGAVLVQSGSLIGTACRGQRNEGVHAEHGLLDDLLRDRVVAGSVLYTTLEPCTERGPGETPCVDRVIARKIDRVVIGMLDPNQKIRGEGIWRLREAGIQVALCGSDQMAQIEDISRKFVEVHRKRR